MSHASIFFFLATYFFVSVASAYPEPDPYEAVEMPTTSDGEYDNIGDQEMEPYYDRWENLEYGYIDYWPSQESYDPIEYRGKYLDWNSLDREPLPSMIEYRSSWGSYDSIEYRSSWGSYGSYDTHLQGLNREPVFMDLLLEAVEQIGNIIVCFLTNIFYLIGVSIVAMFVGMIVISPFILLKTK